MIHRLPVIQLHKLLRPRRVRELDRRPAALQLKRLDRAARRRHLAYAAKVRGRGKVGDDEFAAAAAARVRVVMVIVERMIHRHGVDVDELGALMEAVLADLRGNEAVTVDYAGTA